MILLSASSCFPGKEAAQVYINQVTPLYHGTCLKAATSPLLLKNKTTQNKERLCSTLALLSQWKREGPACLLNWKGSLSSMKSYCSVEVGARYKALL